MTEPESEPDAMIVTADPAILDELLRLCAVAGARPAVAADTATLDRAWTRPTTVLIGADLAALAYARPPHPRAIVVGTAERPPWEAATRLGAMRVALLPAGSAWLAEQLRGGTRDASPSAVPVVCVLAGHGGAGATTLAAALARTAAARVPRGQPPVLAVDADVAGSGLDLTLGLEAAEGTRWSTLLETGPPTGVPEQLLEVLPGRAGLRLLALDQPGPYRLPPDALRSAVTVGARTAGLVVVDLAATDPQLCSAVLPMATLTCVVVHAHLRGVTAARRRLGELAVAAGRTRLVVRGPLPGGMAPGGVERALRLPVAGVLGPEPALERDYARGAPPGRPRGPLARLCAALLHELPAGRAAA